MLPPKGTSLKIFRFGIRENNGQLAMYLSKDCELNRVAKPIPIGKWTAY